MPGALKLPLSGDVAADRLLEDDPLALVIGMVLDQQIPLERAFRSPYDLKERRGGTLDVNDIANADPEQLAAVFATPPALHRFPGSMAKRVQEVCRHLVDEYAGDAAAVWTSAADGHDLYRRVKAMPGFGEQKARIFVALLGKRLGVAPAGWEKAAGEYGVAGSFKSVADIDGPESLGRVRAYKKDMKARAKAAAAPDG
ncbi:MAG TPA: HhH-GPD-type base excision DNA repair protein [Acidimicrobiales bacterium]